MRKLFITLVIGLLALGNAIFAATTLDGPDFDKPVTLAVKGEAISDLLKIMQKQTSVKLRATQDVADHKVTIFVDDKPLKEVMQAISNLFGFEWTTRNLEEGLTYVLADNKNLHDSMENHRSDAVAKAWQSLFKIIELQKDYAKMRSTELQALRKQLEAVPEKDRDEKVKLQIAALKQLSNSPIQGILANIFCDLPLNVRQTLASNGEFRLDSESSEADWMISSDIARQINEGCGSGIRFEGHELVNPPPVNTKPIRVILRFYSKIEPKGIAVKVVVSRGSNSIDAGMPDSYIQQPMMPSIHFTLAEQSIYEAAETVDEPLPNDPMGDLLQKKITINLDELPNKDELQMIRGTKYAPDINRSDILELLHSKLGLQIVSDHYSEWYRVVDTKALADKIKRSGDNERLGKLYGKVNIDGATLGDMIKQCIEQMDAQCGWDGKILYSRAEDIYTAYSAEIPNRILEKWQKAYKRNGALYIDDYADIVVKTTYAQVDRLFRNWNYLDLGPVDALPGHWYESPMLKFYGSLSNKQRDEAFAQGTLVSGFNKNQRTALMAMINSDWQLLDGKDSLFANRGPMGKAGGIAVAFAGVGVYKDGVRLDKGEQVANTTNMPVASVIIRGGMVNEIEIENPILAKAKAESEEDSPTQDNSTEKSTSVNIKLNKSWKVSTQVYMMTVVFQDGTVAEFRIGDTGQLDMKRRGLFIPNLN